MTPASLVVSGLVLSAQVIHTPQLLPATQVTLLQSDGQAVTFHLPGANGGPPAAVLGTPRVEPGQSLTVELVATSMGWVARDHGADTLGGDGWRPIWGLNGNHLPDELLPWPMAINDGGIADIGLERSEEIMQDALDQWSSLACSSFAFDYAGATELGVDDDGVNVLAWESDSWEWDPQAAAMSVVRFDFTGEVPVVRETDILFNAVDWDWVDEPGDATASPPRLHAGSVVAHELGHSTGMDHEYVYVTSTMFYGYYGGDWMATLSGDDHRGLCENYPSGSEGCAEDADCQDLDSSERHCVEIDGLHVCDEVRDPPGSPCFLDDFNCAEVCVFDGMFYSEGYCAVGCPEGSCDEGYVCEAVDYPLPQDAGAVCVPLPEDRGLDSEPADSEPDDSEPGDSEEPSRDCHGCSTGLAPALPTLALPLLLALVRRRRPSRL